MTTRACLFCSKTYAGVSYQKEVPKGQKKCVILRPDRKALKDRKDAKRAKNPYNFVYNTLLDISFFLRPFSLLVGMKSYAVFLSALQPFSGWKRRQRHSFYYEIAGPWLLWVLQIMLIKGWCYAEKFIYFYLKRCKLNQFW